MIFYITVYCFTDRLCLTHASLQSFVTCIKFPCIKWRLKWKWNSYSPRTLKEICAYIIRLCTWWIKLFINKIPRGTVTCWQARKVPWKIPSSLWCKTHLSRQLKYWSLGCNACRRCSNYIFILYLTPGFNRLGKDKCKTRRESFKFLDLVRFILENLRYASLSIVTYSLTHWLIYPPTYTLTQTAYHRG